MFEKLANIGSLLRNAQQIGGQMQQLTEKLKQRRVTGTAGGGMVEIEVNGLIEVIQCRIDQTLMDQGDRELIEDLLASAVNQAVVKGKQMHADMMKELTGGLEIPGMQEVLAKFTGATPSETIDDSEKPEQS